MAKATTRLKEKSLYYTFGLMRFFYGDDGQKRECEREVERGRDRERSKDTQASVLIIHNERIWH